MLFIQLFVRVCILLTCENNMHDDRMITRKTWPSQKWMDGGSCRCVVAFCVQYLWILFADTFFLLFWGRFQFLLIYSACAYLGVFCLYYVAEIHQFAPGFVNYKKGALDSQPQVIKFSSCLPMVGGSLRVLRLPPPSDNHTHYHQTFFSICNL